MLICIKSFNQVKQHRKIYCWLGNALCSFNISTFTNFFPSAPRPPTRTRGHANVRGNVEKCRQHLSNITAAPPCETSEF